MELKRNCSDCGEPIFYKNKNSYNVSLKNNIKVRCSSCAHSGKNNGMFGKHQKEGRLDNSGNKNPMFGKKHTNESKNKISISKKGSIPWNKNKKFPGMFINFNRLGPNNAYIKYILKQENITYEQYKEKFSEFELYKKEVYKITKLQPLSILENYDKRGIKNYHLDHIYPISKGFKNNIPPEIIGDISNLQYIPAKDNLEKSNKIDKKYNNLKI